MISTEVQTDSGTEAHCFCPCVELSPFLLSNAVCQCIKPTYHILRSASRTCVLCYCVGKSGQRFECNFERFKEGVEIFSSYTATLQTLQKAHFIAIT